MLFFMIRMFSEKQKTAEESQSVKELLLNECVRVNAAPHLTRTASHAGGKVKNGN